MSTVAVLGEYTVKHFENAKAFIVMGKTETSLATFCYTEVPKDFMLKAAEKLIVDLNIHSLITSA